jgi:putative membrane protein
MDKYYKALSDFAENGFKTVLYTLLGILLFALTYWVFGKMFPMHKEIEEDQNTALAILMGSVMLGIAIIIAASIH